SERTPDCPRFAARPPATWIIATMSAMAQSRTIESRFAMAGSVTLAAYSAEPPGLRSCRDFAGYGPGMVDQSTRFPDLSARPHELCVERVMNAPASLVYAALTRGFDIWLAAPDSVRMRAEVGEPFYFETEFEGKRNPHYGRFLRLVPARQVEFTWVTARSEERRVGKERSDRGTT